MKKHTKMKTSSTQMKTSSSKSEIHSHVVWDKEYHGSDTPDIVFSGTRDECRKHIEASDKPKRYYIEKYNLDSSCW